MAARDRCAPIAGGSSRWTCGLGFARTRDEIGQQGGIDEVEALNPAAPSDPMHIVRWSVTTVRQSETDSSDTEPKIFERDLNGRFVLVYSESERSSGR